MFIMLVYFKDILNSFLSFFFFVNHSNENKRSFACTQQAKIKDKWEDVLQMSSKRKIESFKMLVI
jgi:hypothetical protein